MTGYINPKTHDREPLPWDIYAMTAALAIVPIAIVLYIFWSVNFGMSGADGQAQKQHYAILQATNYPVVSDDVTGENVEVVKAGDCTIKLSFIEGTFYVRKPGGMPVLQANPTFQEVAADPDHFGHPECTDLEATG